MFKVVIPARYASTRLEGKPLLDIAGKPMVVRVAEQAAKSGANEIIIATDFKKIFDAAETHGYQAVMTRVTHVSGTDRIAEVVQQLAWADDDIVVNVQGDEPLIHPQHIHAVAQLLSQRMDVHMSTLAHPITALSDWLSPHVVKVVLNQGHLASYFSRAGIPCWRDGTDKQLPPYPVYRHVGLYAYRCGFLKAFPRLAEAPAEKAEALEQLRALWHGYQIAVHVSDMASAPGVDTPEDLLRVQALLTR
jgi:3-deoxy-manno-octulosonate cytidylyltransferase (CMP-KDO synthetase)